MFKRLLPVGGIIGLLTLALAGSAAAGGGGGFGGPGLFMFTDWSANATAIDPTTGNFYGSVFVDRGTQSFKLKHTPGAPVVERPGTVLNVSEQSGSGCWIIPDAAFVVASDLSGATLNIHATPDMQCPGFFVGSATGGKPGLQSALGFGGGGPPPTPITDITGQHHRPCRLQPIRFLAVERGAQGVGGRRRPPPARARRDARSRCGR